MALLFIDVPKLEPDVSMGERTWGVAEDAVEAAERLFILVLLFVDDAKMEESLICLLVRYDLMPKQRGNEPTFVHFEDGCKCLLGVVKGAVAVVENADADTKVASAEMPRHWAKQAQLVDDQEGDTGCSSQKSMGEGEEQAM